MTATDAYIAANTTVGDLLTELCVQVEAHQADVDPEHVNWGHVGDLNHVADILGNAISFLSGNES